MSHLWVEGRQRLGSGSQSIKGADELAWAHAKKLSLARQTWGLKSSQKPQAVMWTHTHTHTHTHKQKAFVPYEGKQRDIQTVRGQDIQFW